MCHCMIANLVVSRFPKDCDIRKQWVFVVKRVTKHGSQALMIMMSCVSVTSSILITDH